VELTTDRLLLRRWREEDRDGFAAMNSDPVVMEHFVSVLSRAESDALLDRIEAGFARDGFGLWALEERSSASLMGMTGIQRVPFCAPFTPAVEVGWRLRASAWGGGYATEAASAAVAFGFDTAGLEEIVAMTTPSNSRSIAVMERLGMQRDRDADFDHPRIPAGHPLRRHILYRVQAGVHSQPRT